MACNKNETMFTKSQCVCACILLSPTALQCEAYDLGSGEVALGQMLNATTAGTESPLERSSTILGP
jgi:hypothetical protein